MAVKTRYSVEARVESRLQHMGHFTVSPLAVYSEMRRQRLNDGHGRAMSRDRVSSATRRGSVGG